MLLYRQASPMHFIKAITRICIKSNLILFFYVSVRAAMKLLAFSIWLSPGVRNSGFFSFFEAWEL